VLVDSLQYDRVIGRDLIEFRQRKPAWIVGELFLRPAAEDGDPLARLGRTQAIDDHFQGLLARRDAVEPQLVELRRPYPVGMVVYQSRPDRPAVQIDYPGLAAGKLANLVVASDGDDALPLDRDRLGDREAVVHRHDLAADKDGIGSFGGLRRRN
jgi:hypothetical protein